MKFLSDRDFEFYRDDGYWKNKIYFLVKHNNECVCFIAFSDPDELDNRWTVWSDDIDSEYLNSKSADSGLFQLAWTKVDECSHCGSCSGGKPKKIFGKVFDAVCGCTFRLDNPTKEDLDLIKFMILAKQRQIDNR